MLKREGIVNASEEGVLVSHAKEVRRPYFASMVGAILEYYDSSLYGFMAPILAGIFLPEMNEVNALILAFAIFPLGIISRPLGGLVIGKMGDKLGRKRALIFSLTGMAIATGLIGCMPNYGVIGLAAPVMLAFLNVVQKFFAGGEYNGGAIFMLEHSKKDKGFRSGLYCASAVAGILIASFVAVIVTYLPEGYWRIAYLIGFLTALYGVYIRRRIPETPEFEKRDLTQSAVSLKEGIKKYRWLLLWSIGAAGFFSVLYHIPAVLMNAYVPLVNDISTQQMLLINTVSLFFYMLVLPLFGALGDYLGIRRSMKMAVLATILLAYPLFFLLKMNSLVSVVVMKLSFVLLVAWFVGPFHAWIQDLYDVRDRCLLISLSYSIGTQLGSTMPVLALWAWKHTGIVQIPAVFIIIWGFFGLASVLYAGRKVRT